MSTVRANFSIYNIHTDIEPPDSVNDEWGVFASPDDRSQAIISFNDTKGEIKLRIRHGSSFHISVCGEVEDTVLNLPDPTNRDHQKALIEFCTRGFEVLNHFILRYRLNTFNYRNRPLKWRVSYGGANITLPTEFVIQTPFREADCKLQVEWEVDGELRDLAREMNFRVRQERAFQLTVYAYPEETLQKIRDEVSNSLQGIEPDGSVYETSLELLMHAQEIAVGEQTERSEERLATVCASLITTASACETFVRDFIRRQGSPLHNYIIKEKRNAFSVENLLDKVLADIPQFGQSLKAFNPELAHNVYLLFQARNNAAHKGKPTLNLIHTEQIEDEDERVIIKEVPVPCDIASWMIYSERPRSMIYSDADEDLGSFVWDVLALIEWLRSRVSSPWIKPSVERYWNEQAGLPVRTREKEILFRELRNRARVS